jgi:3-deoxy-D-arabino-heptulosonate 7-phosphate (DAHP) synthase class II
MSERFKYEGHLAVLNQDVKRLKMTLEGLLKAIRDNLDPLEKIEKIDASLVAEQALEFAGKHSVLREKLAEVAKAEEILGRAHDGDKPTWP